MSLADGRFDLLETMAFDPHEGIRLLELHLARMKVSADALGFAFDRHDVRNELQAATFRLRDRSRVRLLVSRGGALAIEVRAHRTWPQAIVPVAVVPRQAPADDPRLRHKTTDRALYRDALRRGGTYEVLLTDAEGFLTEGCFSTLFVERGDKLVTPPLRRGLLPGILRQSLIEMGEAVEEDLRIHDLERGFFIGNAARGMVAATLAR
ncbi:aminotransferase class IV [Sphingobium naphthae]|jgi:4-amino-4-deoxychorismate lyase|uniref:Probable branched-chain-amino-acid aminotransferase n=1 Tax=Sphingobium naphthae TaxID=1886786 RepID=A0ABU3ZU71_9SPHN|nr:aminotransferase class IV [Sphingobium naphthae]MAN11275.1 aminotransferase [Sphingobium sp.]MEC7934131.1 aminotransferase class IV [Pseudomonadota bacterium]PDH67519.1 MAG: aminotransferase [Sphingomonadaceae bacterium MED-G03]MCC4252111.1 aminotransferase class IV [Sphingobium naphthae]MDV5823053.1 aminotransferase class IV [Sphingobium naphthae]|tara:strand:+ start:759 stop:1382 length:624 start_codon:yes stop_codon:yes gene_type:complete